MFNALIKVIFFLITRLFNLLMTPILAVISSLFPNVTPLFEHITSYLTLALTYVRSILTLLLIPNDAIIVLFDYFVVCTTIFYSILAYRFAINLYNKFKL